MNNLELESEFYKHLVEMPEGDLYDLISISSELTKNALDNCLLGNLAQIPFDGSLDGINKGEFCYKVPNCWRDYIRQLYVVSDCKRENPQFEELFN
jgi:hypothetical protein